MFVCVCDLLIFIQTLGSLSTTLVSVLFFIAIFPIPVLANFVHPLLADQWTPEENVSQADSAFDAVGRSVWPCAWMAGRMVGSLVWQHFSKFSILRASR